MKDKTASSVADVLYSVIKLVQVYIAIGSVNVI